MSIQYNDNGLRVMFYAEAVENRGKSRDQGRPIFEDKVLVKINFPGDKHREAVYPATEIVPRDAQPKDEYGNFQPINYAQRFKAQYDKFLAGVEQTEDGTPLSEAPFMTKSKVQELKALHIHTVEQLAQLPESIARRLGPGSYELQGKAKAMLELAAGIQDNSILQSQLVALQEQVARLTAAAEKGATAPVPAAEPEEEAVDPNSPFADWDDDDLKAWLTDAQVQFDGRFGHKKLVALADAENERRKKAKEAA